MTGNKIDKTYRDTILNFEERPPIDAWDNICEKLDGKEKVRKLVYLRAIAASVAVFLSFVAGYYLSQEKLQQRNFANTYKSEKGVLESGKTIYFESENINSNKSKKQKSNSSIYLKSSFNKIEKDRGAKKRIENKTLAYARMKDVHIDENHTQIIKKEIKYLGNAYPDYNLLYNAQYQGQDFEDDDASKRGDWQMGGDVAPVYSFRTANDKASVLNSSNVSSEGLNTTNEKGLLAYSGGLNFGYKPNKRLTIQSGVYYAQIGQIADNVNLQPDPLFTPQEFANNSPKYNGNTSAGKLDTEDDAVREDKGESPDYASGVVEIDNLEQNFQYIEIPFIAKYKFLDKKLDVQLIGGLNTGVLIGNDLYRRNGDTKDRVGETENINKYIYNTITGIGFEYNLSKRISMNFEPTMKYSIMSINENQNFHYRPYSFGVFTGISYKLK